MKNMLEMPIELEPTDGNCYNAYCTKAPAIPGHSQYITAILNGCIEDIHNIDLKTISEIVTCLFNLGLARDFVMEVWQKRYYGNIGLGKALTLSYTCGRCLNTNGLFVVVNGPAGFGKSAGMKTMLDLMPLEYVKQGKESPQAMYYDDMAPGTIRYIDEIKFDNDIKEAWTYFQTGVPKSVTQKSEDEFVTVNATSSKRITYWGSTVDFGADEQIRNRFLQIEVNADAETLAKIHAHNNKKLTGKYQTPVEDKAETAICRAIMKALGPMEYDVIIPFAERTNFGGTDPRTATMFRDAICASSVWNYANRAKDGYGRLEAAEEDFYQALDVFNLIGGQSADKFTDAEKRILNAIINSKNRKASSVEIQRAIGMNGPRFNQVIYGRSNKHEQQKYGLASKCPELIINNQTKPYIFELPNSFILKSGMQVRLMEESKRYV